MRPPSVARASSLQRKCACDTYPSGGECAECARKQLQCKPDRNIRPRGVPPIVRDVLQSPGQVFDRVARQPFERGFGRDFGHVRIHTDDLAAQSARAVGALVYTVGSHLIFASGQYAPHTSQSRKLLAYALTHVVQQTRPSGADNIERDEREADRVAHATAAHKRAVSRKS